MVDREVEKKVDVPYIPNQCRESIALAQKLRGLVDKYEAELGKEDQILGDAHTAIVGKSIPQLNAVVERQRDLKGNTLQLLLDITDAGNSLNNSLKQCNAKVK